MEIDLNNQPALEAFIRTTNTGRNASCPFCAGRMISSIRLGDRILVLQGSNVGKIGTVTAEQGFNDKEFLVHFDGEPTEYETRISYVRDVFTLFPIRTIPTWLCPLSIDDLSVVDEAIIRTSLTMATSKQSWSVETLLPMVSTVRARRLPLKGSDLWPTFEAHGFSPKLQKSFETQFDFSTELLLAMNGRPAIKRKRVKAMSIGRYLTPSLLKFYGPSPGIVVDLNSI